MVEGAQLGAYRLIRKLGEGGMGAVWLAEHTTLGRRAAIKVLHAQYTVRPDMVQRFFNEARAATAISDPGIVQVFDYGDHQDGSAYIVMEALEGETLAARLMSRGPFAIDDAVRILRQVSGTLAAAHAVGIVHRDLKPENVFLVADPEVAGGERAKILDFGIAKLVGDKTVVTQTSAVMGTPTYMSPEQCRGAGGVDHRSDIYSLGCMLFTLVVGTPPFFGDGAGDLIAAHLREPPPVPSSRAPRIPPELDDLILRCLAKDPAERFASAKDLAAALAVPMAVRTIPAPPIATTTAVLANAPTANDTTLGGASGSSWPEPEPARRRRGAWIAPVLAGVAIAGGVAVYAATRGGSEHVAAPTPDAAVTIAAPADAAPPVDPLVAIMKEIAGELVRWMPRHEGDPCPTDLVGKRMDPWGTVLRITCDGQPSSQLFGITSAGPDGRFGTSDDLESWSMPDVKPLLQGTRWAPKIAVVDAKPVKTDPPKPKADPPKPKADPPKSDPPKTDPPKADPPPPPPDPPKADPPKLASWQQAQIDKTRANGLVGQAREAALAGKCAEAKRLGAEISTLNKDAYAMYLADAAIKKCL